MNKILVCISMLFAIVSCSNNDEVVKELIEEKVNVMSGQEVVRDLLIENEGETEQIARIFKCSKYTIERVKDKKTYLTPLALTEFKQLLVAVKITGKKAFKENDPYYDSWIRSFRYWLNDWIWFAVGAWVLIIIIGGILGSQGLGAEDTMVIGNFISIPLIIIFLGGYLITWIGNIFWSYEQPAYLLIQKINPVFETLI